MALLDIKKMLEAHPVEVNELPQGALPVWERWDKTKPVHVVVQDRGNASCQAKFQGGRYGIRYQNEPLAASDVKLDVVTEGDQVLAPCYAVLASELPRLVAKLIKDHPKATVYMAYRPAAMLEPHAPSAVDVAILLSEGELSI